MTSPPPPIFDRRLTRLRLARAATQGAEDFLLVHAIEEFSARLATIKREFCAILDAGTPSPRLAARLFELLHPPLFVRMAPLPGGGRRAFSPAARWRRGKFAACAGTIRFGGLGAFLAKSQRSAWSARSAPPRFEAGWAFSRLPPWRPKSPRVANRLGRCRS